MFNNVVQLKLGLVGQGMNFGIKINNKVKTFNREDWIISSDKNKRYELMRKNLKEMNVFKAFNQGF